MTALAVFASTVSISSAAEVVSVSPPNQILAISETGESNGANAFYIRSSSPGTQLGAVSSRAQGSPTWTRCREYPSEQRGTVVYLPALVRDGKRSEGTHYAEFADDYRLTWAVENWDPDLYQSMKASCYDSSLPPIGAVSRVPFVIDRSKPVINSLKTTAPSRLVRKVCLTATDRYSGLREISLRFGVAGVKGFTIPFKPKKSATVCRKFRFTKPGAATLKVEVHDWTLHARKATREITIRR